MTADTPPEAPLGLHDAAGFRLATGERAGDDLLPAARFLFRDETIALPRMPDASRPPLVWIAAPERRTGARLSPDGRTIDWGGARGAATLVPRIALNRSWADESTFRWLAGRPVSIRGTRTSSGAFEIRTLWPDDWRADLAAPVEPLDATAGEEAALRRFVRAEQGGARADARTRVLWARDPDRREWAGRPVIGLLLNGSQGDDDEAWGGHFAVVTGRLGADGRIADLLVANFYSLDVESEKGILAAPVPLDNYLADLNAGQSWYRPSVLALAVLADERAAAHVDRGFSRVYPGFWSRHLSYRHATMNCAAISIDTLRSLGWPVPAHASPERMRAWLALPAKLAAEGSLDGARNAFEYLAEEPARLFPAVAFEACTADLLRLAATGERAEDGPLARWLAADLLAVVALRMPQIPSARAFGSFPVASPREYLDAWPADPSQARLVPLPPRLFPHETALAAPAQQPRPSDRPVLVGMVTGVLPLAWLVGAAWRALRAMARRQARR